MCRESRLSQGEGQVGVLEREQNECNFEPFLLTVEGRFMTREEKIEACTHCGDIKSKHLKDYVESLRALGVSYSLVKIF